MRESPNHERGLLKVMVIGTSLSFGILGALMASMAGFFRGSASFEFSWRMFFGFAVGYGVGWLFWRFIIRRAAKSDHAESHDG